MLFLFQMIAIYGQKYVDTPLKAAVIFSHFGLCPLNQILEKNVMLQHILHSPDLH